MGCVLTTVEAVDQARAETGLQKPRRLANVSARVRKRGCIQIVGSCLWLYGTIFIGKLEISRFSGPYRVACFASGRSSSKDWMISATNSARPLTPALA